MKTIFTLVDCNNFYVSCERVFNPKLIGKPVIVLSNNDGCAVARSEEAKAIGIRMGVPVFEIKHIIQKYNVEVLSSNYALYADMSQRVMESLTSFTSRIEIYSIDEAFLDLSEFPKENLTEYASQIQATVKQWTGVPVSIGIAETKTLSKIANRLAKKSGKTKGVLNLLESPYIDKALERTEVDDVWGIGRKYAMYLKNQGINNALQLRDADIAMIKGKMGVMGTRLIQELRGNSCFPLDAVPHHRKSILSSRTFKNGIRILVDLKEAIATYVSRGAEKLRKQHSVAGVMVVFIATNRFDKDNFYKKYKIIPLTQPTNNTSELIRYAHNGLQEIFKEGLRYKRAGILLDELSSDAMVQLGLFDKQDKTKSDRLMKCMDQINIRMGQETIKIASAGLCRNPIWRIQFHKKSKEYTTNWNELPEVV